MMELRNISIGIRERLGDDRRGILRKYPNIKLQHLVANELGNGGFNVHHLPVEAVCQFLMENFEGDEWERAICAILQRNWHHDYMRDIEGVVQLFADTLCANPIGGYSGYLSDAADGTVRGGKLQFDSAMVSTGGRLISSIFSGGRGSKTTFLSTAITGHADYIYKYMLGKIPGNYPITKHIVSVISGKAYTPLERRAIFTNILYRIYRIHRAEKAAHRLQCIGIDVQGALDTLISDMDFSRSI